MVTDLPEKTPSITDIYKEIPLIVKVVTFYLKRRVSTDLFSLATMNDKGLFCYFVHSVKS